MVVSAKVLSLAGAATLLGGAAFAADLPPLPPSDYGPPVMVDPGVWYLRGYVGAGIQSFRSFDFTSTNTQSNIFFPPSWRVDQKSIKDTFLFGAGIGYQWNDWLRVDFTGDYRTDAKFKAVASYFNGVNQATDRFDGTHSAVVLLANVYLDLGTWWCLTPFVGVGLGGAFHRISPVTDLTLNTDGLGGTAFRFSEREHTQWNFTWALHAGAAYSITNNVKLEVAYRYLNMGNVQTAEVICGASGCGSGLSTRAFYSLMGLDSHDFMIGLRWMLQQELPPPPVIRKG